MSRQILVVEDDRLLRNSLTIRLESEGYAVEAAQDGREALESARGHPPDLVLLDIGLPDLNGLDVARLLQGELNLPIVFLTARGQEADIVAGLELGAEDYITKPFGMRELLARIRMVLRRAERAAPSEADGAEGILRVGELALDSRQHLVWVRDRAVELAPKQFALLRLLMVNAGTVLTTDYLLETVWGEEYAGAVQVLYVHVGWLREHIELDARRPRLLVTVRGVGYKLAAEEEQRE
jgi:two-component system response regulator RegX3